MDKIKDFLDNITSDIDNEDGKTFIKVMFWVSLFKKLGLSDDEIRKIFNEDLKDD